MAKQKDETRHRRYRGYQVNLDRDNGAWLVSVMTPDGKLVWEEGWFDYMAEALEEARYAIDEHIASEEPEPAGP